MTHPLIKQCDKNYDWIAYIRVGLYLVARNGYRTNFCDIHLAGLPDEIKGIMFSGPKDAMKDVNRFERTDKEQIRYLVQGSVSPAPGVAEGGYAKTYIDRDKKTVRVWLFGPLLFQNVAYGSLVADLNGMVMPKMRHEFKERDPKTGQQRERTDPKRSRFHAIFPGSYGSYMPCKLWGSDYLEGVKPLPLVKKQPDTAPSLDKALDSAKDRVKPAILPKDAVKVVWKVEEYKDQLTWCQIVGRGG
jgi:hypothetical protein